MFHFLVGSLDKEKFLFESSRLVSLALSQWTDARTYLPIPDLVGRVEIYISFSSAEAEGVDSTIAVAANNESLGIDTTSQKEAARIMAWLARSLDIPADGTVIVMNWSADEAYPLLPGVTEEQLMADCDFNN